MIFATEWASVIAAVEGISGLALFLGAYRHLICNKDGCYRLGRYSHGHLRLCSHHHPLVPVGGVSQDHIDAVTDKLNGGPGGNN